jgi:hypothetical protein
MVKSSPPTMSETAMIFPQLEARNKSHQIGGDNALL